MKLQFEPNLSHQQEAISAVRDLFGGQEASRTKFAVSCNLANQDHGFRETGFGVGNRLRLEPQELLANLRHVQLRNGLIPAESLQSLDFTVAMETGTGKTYVYLRTIFELNHRYGFAKFVVAVPSLATKEGVIKSLQVIAPHLQTLYEGRPFEYFAYDSKNLGQVWNFATSPQIQIMVLTVGALNERAVKSTRQPNEKTCFDEPFDLIGSTSPVLIIDEAQSVESTLKEQGRQALAAMNSLCTLRYSATYRDKHHMIYRLDVLEAYERKLIKQIEVASGVIVDYHNRPYVRLVALHRKRNVIRAEVEIDAATKNGSVRRRKLKVSHGDELERKTRRSMYRNHLIDQICVEQGGEYMDLLLPNGYRRMQLGDIYGGFDPIAVHQGMIEKTIQEHLDKELLLLPHGVKVLTLFFIDHAARYRRYNDQGEPLKGEYAHIFENEYEKAAQLPKYKSLFRDVDFRRAAVNAHGGYFPIDEQGRLTDAAENGETDSAEAERAYRLIMRDKERLLELGEPLKFIFSHSVLREGWDNPNVFQICTLRDNSIVGERWQAIGRGSRLCVDQEGKRQCGIELNTLSIIAFEDYTEYSENLRKEIEQETGFPLGQNKP